MHALPFSRRQALIAGLGCWLVFGLIAVLVQTGATRAFDTAGMLAWRAGPDLAAIGPAGLTGAFRAITMLGDAQVRNIVVLAAIGILLVLRHTRTALWLAPVVLPAGLFNGWLKLQFVRPRPDMVPHIVEAGGFSFPSGHAFSSAVLYLALVLPFAALATGRARQWTIIAAGLTIAALVAFSRVWLGVHYPSDVLAGWLGGVGWVLLAWAALQPWGKGADQIFSR